MISKTIVAIFTLSIICCAQTKLPSVAVMNLEAQTLDKETVRSITDAVADEVIKSRKARVMERSQMEQILKEQGFQQSGACDGTECAVAVGKLLSIDQMIVGSIGKIGESYTISLRLVKISTGELINSSRIMQRGAIDEIVGNSIPKIVSQLFVIESQREPIVQKIIPIPAAPIAVPMINKIDTVKYEKRNTKFDIKENLSKNDSITTKGNYTLIGRIVLGTTAIGSVIGALMIEDSYQKDVSTYRNNGGLLSMSRSNSTKAGEITLSAVAAISTVLFGLSFAY